MKLQTSPSPNVDLTTPRWGKKDNCPECINLNLDQFTVTASRIFDGGNFGTNYSLGDFGTGFSLAGEGMWLLGESRSTTLYQQGFRRGLNGNYQLSGRNLSLFGNQEMTSLTKPLTGLSSFGKLLSNFGTALGGAGTIVDSYQFIQGDLSATRYGYHLAGTGASYGAGYFLGGPYGASVGGLFFLGEKAWDMTRPLRNEISNQYWQFRNDLGNALRIGWRPR